MGTHWGQRVVTMARHHGDKQGTECGQTVDSLDTNLGKRVVTVARHYGHQRGTA